MNTPAIFSDDHLQVYLWPLAADRCARDIAKRLHKNYPLSVLETIRAIYTSTSNTAFPSFHTIENPALQNHAAGHGDPDRHGLSEYPVPSIRRSSTTLAGQLGNCHTTQCLPGLSTNTQSLPSTSATSSIPPTAAAQVAPLCPRCAASNRETNQAITDDAPEKCPWILG